MKYYSQFTSDFSSGLGKKEISAPLSRNAPCELRVEEKNVFYVGIVGIHLRQTDGWSGRQTENLRRYCTYGTNHKSCHVKKNKRAKNLLYGTVTAQITTKLLPEKNWARPEISKYFL
jgi:hypothetical protein